MNDLLRLSVAVFEKQYILLRRYWINTIMMIIAFYLFFVFLFFGGQAIGGESISNSLDNLVVGFFLFLAATTAYFDIARNVMREAEWGTLEQLCLSPFGINLLLGIRTIFNMIINIFIALVLLFIMILTTGQPLSIDVITIIPLLVVTVLPAIGLGYLFAGLSLLYKRIENIQQLIQFLFIGLIAAPNLFDGFFLAILPLSLGSDLLTQALTENVRLWEFSSHEIALLIGNSIIYLISGNIIFQILVKRARTLGVIGHY